MTSPALDESGENSAPPLRAMTGDEIRELLRMLAKAPAGWTIALFFTAGLAAIKLNRSPNGDVSASFEIGKATLISLGLIWLPMLLKVFAVVGGSFKAAGVEASLPGVLTKSDAIDLSIKARQVVGARDEVDRAAAAAELEDSITKLAMPVLSSVDALPDSVLSQLARKYERLRREMPPGPPRTNAMTRIVNEAGVRASTAIPEARAKALRLLGSPAEGDRIVGLALAQETADPGAAEELLRLIAGSSSAFEMYHALRALQETAPALSADQRVRALATLERESADPRSVGINQDPGLSYLLPRITTLLRESV